MNTDKLREAAKALQLPRWKPTITITERQIREAEQETRIAALERENDRLEARVAELEKELEEAMRKLP